MDAGFRRTTPVKALGPIAALGPSQASEGGAEAPNLPASITDRQTSWSVLTSAHLKWRSVCETLGPTLLSGQAQGVRAPRSFCLRLPHSTGQAEPRRDGARLAETQRCLGARSHVLMNCAHGSGLLQPGGQEQHLQWEERGTE